MMFAALLLSPALTKMLNSVKDGLYIAGRESFGSRQVQAELCIGKISFEMAALEKNGAVLSFYSCQMGDEFAPYGVPDDVKLNPAIS